MVVVIVLAVIAAVYFLLGCLITKAAFGARCEGNPNLKYFTADDFPGLNARPVEFPSNKGQKLRGAVYTAEGAEPRALVVFAHGMGGGHLSYTTEINTIARAGFAVLSYDNTGTMASEGEALGSFYQAVRDIKAALDFARNDEELKNYKILLAGHSWGAYTVLQALAFAKAYVKGVVAFSPPDSTAAVICDNVASSAGFPADWLKPSLWVAAALTSGLDSVRSCSSVLFKTGDVPVLIFQGDSDNAVKLHSSPVSREALARKKNVTLRLLPGRHHNVYQTSESEKYLSDTFAAIGAAEKKYGKAGVPAEEMARLYDIDYQLITREDPEIMAEVTGFLNSCLEK